jgi:hypothetical protein
MKRIALLAALAVGACTSTGQNALTTYSSMGQVFTADGTDWRINDRPELGSMLVSQSFADAANPFGPLGVDVAAGRRVAAAYLAPKGCSITGAKGIVASVEVTYAC